MIVRLLYDAVLPESLSEEAPAELTLDRWEGGDKPDSALIRAAANRGYQGVVFYGRDSLEQQELRKIARTVGVALLAVEAADPIDARWRVLHNYSRIRRMLTEHDCLLILAREVRNYSSE